MSERLVSLALFAALMWLRDPRHAPVTTVFAAGVIYAPKLRRPLVLALSVLTWAWYSFAIADGVPIPTGPVATALGLFALAAGGVAISGLSANHPALRRLAIPAAILACGALTAFAHASLWVFGTLALVSRQIWFFAFDVAEAPARRGFLARLSAYLPFWQYPFPVPQHKGEAFLARHEARFEAEAADSRRRGLRLLAWMLILVQLWAVIDRSLFGAPRPSSAVWLYAWAHVRWTRQLPTLGLPRIETILALPATSAPGTGLLWLIFLVDAFERLLLVIATGHVAIGLARFFGFRLPRNAWSPLRATRFADFWARYNFYVKEFLMEFFFYPAFSRIPLRSRTTRVFLSAFFAACCGNLLFHLFKDFRFFTNGFAAGLRSYSVYVLYTILLGIAVGVSMVRSLRAGEDATERSRFPRLSTAGCFVGYALLSLFDFEPYNRFLFETPADALRFLLLLIGVRA